MIYVGTYNLHNVLLFNSHLSIQELSLFFMYIFACIVIERNRFIHSFFLFCFCLFFFVFFLFVSIFKLKSDKLFLNRKKTSKCANRWMFNVQWLMVPHSMYEQWGIESTRKKKKIMISRAIFTTIKIKFRLSTYLLNVRHIQNVLFIDDFY